MRRSAALCVAALLVLLGLAPVQAAASTFRAGAAVVDITPPAFDAATDAAAFPLCPPSVFTGPRAFALQEPYVDLDGSGSFNYPEPFCDANTNSRYDGLYLSGAVDHIARRVHDRIDARAFAVSSGASTVVVVSVTAQGIFENYTRRMRDAAKAKAPSITDVLISSDHNESSPDSVGIYGSPNVGDVTGARSGIDEYYMDFVIDRVATAAAKAVAALRPATLLATQVRLPGTMSVNLSKNFPTTDDAGKGVATDPKVGVLQARDSLGHAIFTTMSLAAHNQQVGHHDASSYDISGDWPGYFSRALERHGGMGVPLFLVGDNGSIEDPITVPPVKGTGAYPQAQATGVGLARVVTGAVRSLAPLRPGAVRLRRTEFDVPLENNIFKAAAAAGLFGQRQTYIAGVPAGQVGTDLRTSVSVIDLGPDLQLMANPGESFPALAVGSHWGIEDASCPERPNPPVWTWHGGARWRFQVGLADDLIGYLIPAWGFSTTVGVYPTTCYDDANDKDPRGHQHKLETESVGYTAANAVAEHLTALLAADPDPHAAVARGRWLLADGSATRRPEHALGLALADGTVLAGPGVRGFARHAAVRGARFIDYDGTVQAQPDLTTHGMLRPDGRRVYVDVYPALTVPAMGAALRARSVPPRSPGSSGSAGSGIGGGHGHLPATGASSPLTWTAALLLTAALVLTRRRTRRRVRTPAR